MNTTIILAAGTNSLDFGYTTQMLPIRGKPALHWVVDSVYTQNNNDRYIIIVLSKNNNDLKTYLEYHFPNIKIFVMNIHEQSKKIDVPFSILHSILYGMEKIPEESNSVSILLGDSIISNSHDLDTKEDFILTSTDFLSSERWCLIESDSEGYIKAVYDKQRNMPDSEVSVAVGYYHFNSVHCLKKDLETIIQDGKQEISDLLIAYSQNRRIKCIATSHWIDLGHKENIVNKQGYFLNSRDFNTLIVDPVRGSVKKISTKPQKLSDEAAWYQSLPQELQVLSPRVLSFSQNADSAELELEMYGYPILSELFVFGSLAIEEWNLILKRLFNTHSILKKYSGVLSKDNFYDLYFYKTWERLHTIQSQNSFLESLWQYKYIIINGIEYKNIQFIQNKLNIAIDNIIKTCTVTLMHGDFCFSNILFDTNTFICRLIDPRGRLKEQTIYGDPRYDIAKLRHSVVGGYDFIVHGFCSMTGNENNFDIKINSHRQQELLNETFDLMTIEYGYDINQIKLIEGLLFASMIPLHGDSLTRQIIFYLQAVKKLNECLGER